MNEAVILLVEDNADDRDLTLRALEKNNIANKVVIAPDGQQALDYMYCEGAHAGRDPRAVPSVILLDLNLPKIDGLEVLRRLRAKDRTKLVPVVILTTSDEQKDIIQGYKLGCNSYVRKPIDFGQFREAVRQLGLYWLSLNVPAPARASA
jgi:two-component system response regulator